MARHFPPPVPCELAFNDCRQTIRPHTWRSYTSDTNDQPSSCLLIWLFRYSISNPVSIFTFAWGFLTNKMTVTMTPTVTTSQVLGTASLSAQFLVLNEDSMILPSSKVSQRPFFELALFPLLFRLFRTFGTYGVTMLKLGSPGSISSAS